MHKGIICGRGGQGIITVNSMLGEVASRLGLGALSAETHGMAMRGGSVATFIKIGHHASPSIGAGEADFMIATDAVEGKRNLSGCAANALCIIDAPQTTDYPDMKCVSVDATGIAVREFGSAIAAGSILLGIFFAHNEKEFERTRVLSILKDIFPKAVSAVERGYKEVNNAGL
jgi:indolepyruvate ferredoxin oxidoreductase, beta subunit